MLKLRPGLFIFLICLVWSTRAFCQVPTNPVIDTTITHESLDNDADNIPIVSLDDNDGQDGSAQNISGQLTAGRNPFLNAANFQFSAVRFRIRGYDADFSDTYMNGIPMENLDIQRFRPPVAVGPSVHDRALARALVIGLCVHRFLSRRVLIFTSVDGCDVVKASR